MGQWDGETPYPGPTIVPPRCAEHGEPGRAGPCPFGVAKLKVGSGVLRGQRKVIGLKDEKGSA